MTKVEKLEQEVQKLTRTELFTFRNWFRQFDSDDWDMQIEEDVCSGKLDKLAKKALAEHKAGRTKQL